MHIGWERILSVMVESFAKSRELILASDNSGVSLSIVSFGSLIIKEGHL